MEKDRNISDEREREQNPLRPDQLTPGAPRQEAANNRRPEPTMVSTRQPPASATHCRRPSLARAPAVSSVSMFGNKKEEAAKFTGEPPRASLTEPPPGYQTPSPDQPYGVGKAAPESRPITSRPFEPTRVIATVVDLASFAWLTAYTLFSCCEHARNKCQVQHRDCQDKRRTHRALSRRLCLALAAEQAGTEVADFTLANGLELVVIPDHRAPVVTHMIWYKVGAADETPGKSGLAHFLEHLMFKGTAKNPAGKFSQVVVAHRRPGKRFHLAGLHRLFPARAERAAQDGDGIRSRPHDRAAADRRRRSARAQCHSRGAEPARWKQSARPSRRADRCRALSQSSLRQAGDRLASRNGSNFRATTLSVSIAAFTHRITRWW